MRGFTAKVSRRAKQIGEGDVITSAVDIVNKAKQELKSGNEVGAFRADNVARRVNRKRVELRPQDPKDMNFVLHHDSLPDDFWRDDIEVEGRRHLLFSTSKQLDVLRRSSRWYIDGTFKCMRAPFMMLLTIHSFIRRADCTKQVPLMFAVRSGKSISDYVAVFQSIQRMLGNHNVQGMVIDYETAIWRAVRQVFDEIRISGCSFHWGQAVFRKVKKLGLSTMYSRDNATHSYIRQLLCLPFLPKEHIKPTFEYLVNFNTCPAITPLLDYMNKTWFESTVWSVEEWCLFGQSIRTNNDVEDETKFGHKLMEKMGWSKGKGLGAKEDGKTEHISVTLKNDTRGVGCSKSHVDNWIAHQDDFNALLANLGQDHCAGASTQEETDTKVLSLEQTSRSSKGRVHYQKFTKGKDLSLKSETDLDCVFGKRKSQSGISTPQAESGANTPKTQSEPNSDNEENMHGLITVTSTDSVQDYFKKKMAERLDKLKANRADSVQLEDAWTNRNKVQGSEMEKEIDAEQNKKSKKNSKKRKLDDTDGIIDQNTEIVTVMVNVSANSAEEVKKKKKSKKRRKGVKDCETENDIEAEKKEDNHLQVPNDNLDDNVPNKKKSKKRKVEITDSLGSDDKNIEQVEERLEGVVKEESISDNKPKKKKKKSKKQKMDKTEDVEVVTPAKQKKRVSFKLGEDDTEELSKEKSDKTTIKTEESEMEYVQNKELVKNKGSASEVIKSTSVDKSKATESTLRIHVNDYDNLETKLLKNTGEARNNVKVAPSQNNRDASRLMAVREVKKTGEAFRGANINHVKGYVGMKTTPVDVKKKLDMKNKYR